ncbi:MAG: hypothetical protein ACRCUS_01730 [Anaerovoracaceae bacterium]
MKRIKLNTHNLAGLILFVFLVVGLGFIIRGIMEPPIEISKDLYPKSEKIYIELAYLQPVIIKNAEGEVLKYNGAGHLTGNMAIYEKDEEVSTDDKESSFIIIKTDISKKFSTLKGKSDWFIHKKNPYEMESDDFYAGSITNKSTAICISLDNKILLQPKSNEGAKYFIAAGFPVIVGEESKNEKVTQITIEGFTNDKIQLYGEKRGAVLSGAKGKTKVEIFRVKGEKVVSGRKEINLSGEAVLLNLKNGEVTVKVIKM